jgi:6-phospho-beta-glucosidase
VQLVKAVKNADFVVNSLRVGGMSRRALDERIAIEHGLAGQETTGPGGAAMALRTVPVALLCAKTVERVAPQACFVNFTNPAGLVTQALLNNTTIRVIGICDTPAELFHRIAVALGEPYNELSFDYAGLNHLGWIRRIRLRGKDITSRILSNSALLQKLYSSDLFDPALIQTLGLIPTEYLFFYYSQRKAYSNQMRAGASRGEELQRLNEDLFRELKAIEQDDQALAIYRAYLMRRNASYMKLEGEAGSAFRAAEEEQDPFETATGYHRIALEVMTALVSEKPKEIVVNVANRGAIEDLQADDVVEVPCDVDRSGAHPRQVGRLPNSVRGLVQSVKAYERTTIEASLRSSRRLAQLALLEYPIVGQWDLAGEVLESLCGSDPQGLGYLRQGQI